MAAGKWFGGVAGLLFFLTPMPAQAGVFADDLTRCIVSSATEGDRTELVKWMFGAMSTNPAIKSLANVTDAQRTAFSKRFVEIMERLLLTDCRKQATAAVKSEGMGVIENAFQALGEIAGRSLLASPEAAQAMGDIQTFMDKPKWEAFGKEAGMPAP